MVWTERKPPSDKNPINNTRNKFKKIMIEKNNKYVIVLLFENKQR